MDGPSVEAFARSQGKPAHPGGSDAMGYRITDELWAILLPWVARAKQYQCEPAPVLPEQRFFETLLYLA
jgi:hypothetical protein